MTMASIIRINAVIKVGVDTVNVGQKVDSAKQF